MTITKEENDFLKKLCAVVFTCRAEMKVAPAAEWLRSADQAINNVWTRVALRHDATVTRIGLITHGQQSQFSEIAFKFILMKYANF